MSAEGFTGLDPEVRLTIGINIAGVNAGMRVGFWPARWRFRFSRHLWNSFRFLKSSLGLRHATVSENEDILPIL
jgi:hypothetical protein